MSNDTSAEQERYKAYLKALMKLPGNTECCDCTASNPTWASANIGVFICIECAGLHRSLGSHISFVRSCDMDKWQAKHVENMRLRGNSKVNEYYMKNFPSGSKKPDAHDTLSVKKQFVIKKYVEKAWFGNTTPSEDSSSTNAQSQAQTQTQTQSQTQSKNTTPNTPTISSSQLKESLMVKSGSERRRRRRHRHKTDSSDEDSSKPKSRSKHRKKSSSHGRSKSEDPSSNKVSNDFLDFDAFSNNSNNDQHVQSNGKPSSTNKQDSSLLSLDDILNDSGSVPLTSSKSCNNFEVMSSLEKKKDRIDSLDLALKNWDIRSSSLSPLSSPGITSQDTKDKSSPSKLAENGNPQDIQFTFSDTDSDDE